MNPLKILKILVFYSDMLSDETAFPRVARPTAGFVYLLVITPPPGDCKRIMQLKSQLARTCASGIALSRPHITVAQFFAGEKNEEMIIRAISNTAAAYKPFRIRLENYGSFPQHTVYIHVDAGAVLKNLSADLRYAVYHLLIRGIENRRPHFLTRAHLTIIRRMERGHWCSAVRICRRLSYRSAFTATGMYLLKWMPEKEAYRQIAQIPFSDRKPRPRQLPLF
ncbi:MAG: 2'-5' RNA ligase family protein [Flavihumibacter sp.]